MNYIGVQSQKNLLQLFDDTSLIEIKIPQINLNLNV